MTKKLPNRVWIDRANNRGFWQKIEYPDFKYRDFCSLIGHKEEFCRKKLGLKGRGSGSDLRKAEKTVKPTVEATSVKQHYVPVPKQDKLPIPVVGTSGAKNDMGAAITEESHEDAGDRRPMAIDPVKVVLSNKFESLTEFLDDDEGDHADKQLMGMTMAHDSVEVVPESTEECLREAGYTTSEIKKVVGPQVQHLQQENGNYSGDNVSPGVHAATPRGSTSDSNGEVTVGQNVSPGTNMQRAAFQLAPASLHADSASHPTVQGPNTGVVSQPGHVSNQAVPQAAPQALLCPDTGCVPQAVLCPETGADEVAFQPATCITAGGLISKPASRAIGVLPTASQTMRLAFPQITGVRTDQETVMDVQASRLYPVAIGNLPVPGAAGNK